MHIREEPQKAKEAEGQPEVSYLSAYKLDRRCHKGVIEAVCFDLGDTLIAEETVVRDNSGQAISTEVVEDAFEVLETIRKDGYRISLIANADSIDARNVVTNCSLENHFDVIIISEEVGVEKPAREIFEAALEKLKVKAENAIMVGNRIDSDIVGANRIGMKNVWFKWNDRYNETVGKEEDKPDFTIGTLSELLGILRVCN